MYDTVGLIILIFIVIVLINYHDYEAEQSQWQVWKTNRINWLWSLAQKSMLENDLIKAESSLLTILNLDPHNAAAYNRIGILYAKQNEYLDAVECFQAAYKIKQNVNSVHNLGLAYYSLEKYEQAASTLQRAIELDDQSAIRYVEYAKVLERLGRTKSMLTALEKATELEPKEEMLKILIKAYRTYKLPNKARQVEKRLKSRITTFSEKDHLKRSDSN